MIYLRKTKMMKQIEGLYDQHNLEYLATYEKAKAVLSIYRNVVWSLKNTAVSYTHLDVYKRQPSPYSFELPLFPFRYFILEPNIGRAKMKIIR